MAGAIKIAYVAARLRILASGEVDLADPDTLARAVELLAEFTPAERQQIGTLAVEMGAQQMVVQSLINIAGGEVIEVSAKAPRRWWWLWLLGGGAAAAGIGVAVGRRARRGRRAVKTLASPPMAPSTKAAITRARRLIKALEAGDYVDSNDATELMMKVNALTLKIDRAGEPAEADRLMAEKSLAVEAGRAAREKRSEAEIRRLRDEHRELERTRPR